MARPTLRKGMSGAAGTDTGEAILLWRKFLGKPELLPPPGTKTYDFGKATHDATVEFQKKNGLEGDGVVGPVTWAKYEQRTGASAPAPVQVKAAAANLESEAAKAAAMARAVTKPATPKPQPTAPTPVTASTPMEKVKEVRSNVQNKIQETVDTLKTKSDAMPMWQRILSVGLIGLAGLAGYKAVAKKSA